MTTAQILELAWDTRSEHNRRRRQEQYDPVEQESWPTFTSETGGCAVPFLQGLKRIEDPWTVSREVS